MIIIQQTAKGGGALPTGAATEAKQDSQITLATAGNASLSAIIALLTSAQTPLVDTSADQLCTAVVTALTSADCKFITLQALSTNAANIEYTISGGATMYLEPGYSVIINVPNADQITIAQPGGEADTAYYIITI